MKRIEFAPKVEITATSEWQELMTKFITRINPGRVEAGYKPYTEARMGKELSRAGYNTTTLARDLYKKCDTEAKSFSKLLSHLLKQ